MIDTEKGRMESEPKRLDGKSERMNSEEKRRYIRLIYARTFKWFSVGLVISVIIGALYGDQMYTVWAMCAVGSVFICWGWFIYLRLDGMRVFGFKPNPKGQKVPYFHQRIKEKRSNRPAFRKDSADFDDDLNDATLIDAERFTERQQEMVRVWERAIAGALLFAVSFLI